jgi:probable H4MPT-linked C1 transfer pathway protein
MTSSAVIGWDLGGAHLKAARLGKGGVIEAVIQLACPLWQGMSQLHAALRMARSMLGSAPVHAVTMTGEMVDLFPDRYQGVRQLVEAMGEHLPPAALRFFALDGAWLGADQAAEAGPRLASANWLASATTVARKLGNALFVDVGSTTVDIIPICGGRVRARGRDDGDRLIEGELVYTGVVRTPVMALAERVPWRGGWAPVIPELFATAADIYRIRGLLAEGADLHPTADGADRTPEASARRLARMIGRDAASAPFEVWHDMAGWLAEEQARRIADACLRVVTREGVPPDAPLVGAGVGRFLLPRGSGRPSVDFASLIEVEPDQREKATDCAPAVAVAWLAATA